MVSTTTYGDFPGVRVETAGGAITGVAVGREQKVVIIGPGDASAGDANAGEATQIVSRLDADRQFGSGTELAEGVKDALANGANIDFLYGIILPESTINNEVISSSSGTLANPPIFEDEASTGAGNEGSGTVTVTDVSASADLTLEYRYTSPPSTPSDGDTAFINPITGEFEADAAPDGTDYEIDYTYYDWQSARNEAETVIDNEESAVLVSHTESETIATDISGDVNTMREDYKMAMGVSAAEPNANASSDNDAYYDTSTYTDSIDNDAYYLHAPARKEDSTHTITGAVGGLMAGQALDESIFNVSLTVDDLDQRLSNSEADDLRNAEVIPIQQPQTGGAIVVDDNVSTSTETDWNRDYFARRVVDQVILITKAVGDSVLGRINDDDTRDVIRNELESQLRGLANDRLIEPREDGNEAWFYEVYEVDADTVGIDLGVTPEGIAKRIDTTITINA